MRKVVLIALFLITASFNLAAFTPHDEGSKEITLKAYYKGQNQNNKAVSLTIKDGSDTAIYHGSTAIVTFSNTEEDSFSFEPIFTWTLEGEGFNSSCSVSLKFTFKALMAYVDGYDTYYVPGHEFTMTTPVVSGGAGSVLSVSNANGATVMSPFPAKTGDYQYPEYDDSDIYKWISYTGTMTPDVEGNWQVSGSCNLSVTSYSKLAGIALNYKGDVKVEFTVQ